MFVSAVKTEARNWFGVNTGVWTRVPSRSFLNPAGLSRALEEHMLPTACIMTPIKAINNHNGHPDIYVTVTGMRNEAFKSEGNL